MTTPAASEPPCAAPVVIFDGDCVLCHRSVRWIVQRDHNALFWYATRASAPGRALLGAHGLDPEATDSVVLIADGRAHLRSDAALEIAARLGGIRGFAAAAARRIIPRILRDAVYSAIARRRVQWFGRTEEACLLLPGNAQSRLLK